jgi:hypothetical protein
MPLLDQLTQSLGPSALQAISQKLGTDPSTASTAVSAALPALIGALARNASTPSGASALDTALATGHDGSVLTDVQGAVNNFESGPGAGILSHVLGNSQSAMASTLGQVAGLDAPKAGALLTMLAPIVMGALGQAKRSNGLDAGSLASMLGQEHQTLSASAPSGLGSLLQMLDANHDGSVADDVMGMASKFLGRQ